MDAQRDASRPTSVSELQTARQVLTDRIEALIEESKKLKAMWWKSQDKDTRLEAVNLEIRELKCQNYDLAPISRLPSEILGVIFAEHIASCWDAHDRLSHTPVNSAGKAPKRTDAERVRWWFPVLHVCQRWREVAFATPQLWTRIQSALYGHVRQAVEHSGRMPLTVRLFNIEPKGRPPLEIYRLILWELPRLRHAELCITPGVFGILSCLESRGLEAPLLEVLRIRRSFDELDVPIFSTIALPKLTKLSITKGHLSSVRSLARSTVQHLKLSDFRKARIAIVDILSVLEQLPSLRSLSVRRVIKDHPVSLDNGFPGPERTVDLPHLEALDMCDEFSGYMSIYMFNSLVFPSTTRISVHAMRFANPQARSIMLPAFARKVMAPGPFGSPSVHPVSVAIGYAGADTIKFWSTTIHEFRRTDCLAERPPYLDICFPAYTNLTVRTFFESLDTSSVVSMWVEAKLAGNAWISAFRDMEQLETLFVGADAVEALMTVLGKPLPSDPGVVVVPTQDSRYLFPSLKTLELAFASLPLKEDEISLVLQALGHRKEIGHGLASLRVRILKHCKLPNEEIGSLNGLADRVILVGPDSDLESPKSKWRWADSESEDEDSDREEDSD
ncbi:hypothetical protein NM688_g3257 [Phlebia brevispora]|uniref:Uncharacterized protein n=1 Tax=Phlebia brevispora TaxID=194682 RepID=A0ACC1T649_9APHY|nr:hypothetical protein NM688_g3257 [Phlebia brevispora]